MADDSKATECLIERLMRHEGGAMAKCLCGTMQNCSRCDCGLAAREIDRLRGLVQFFADQAGMGPSELMERHGV